MDEIEIFMRRVRDVAMRACAEASMRGVDAGLRELIAEKPARKRFTVVEITVRKIEENIVAEKQTDERNSVAKRVFKRSGAACARIDARRKARFNSGRTKRT